MSIGGATYDLFVRTDHKMIHPCEGKKSFTLPLGAKVHVTEVIETGGGGACNTSVGLSRLGCEANVCSVVGDDQWGDKLLEIMNREHVCTDCVTQVEGEVSSFSIILSASSGERVILNTPGTNVHLHDVTFARHTTEKVDWVYFNRIHEEACVIEDDIIEILAKEGPPRFTWNPGGCQLDVGIEAPNNKTMLSYTDLLLLNKTEAMKFTKTESVDDALKVLTDIGVKNVCITDGANGTIASDGNNTFHCPVVTGIDVIDTTGAGDAFGTGATWALLNGDNLPTALKAGSINAASVVGAIGAQAGLLTETDMINRLKECQLDVETRSL